jgi:lysophospholipase L1-like esterase
MSSGRAVALRLLLLIISIGIFLATGEIALRVIYRDQGARTLGAPGQRRFEHLATDGQNQRGRFDAGNKTPGKPRILVLGDSITWGRGVRDWQDTWPERVARSLEQAGTPHEMAVLSLPGRNIPGHLAGLEDWGQTLQPDVFIYQWYINDIEVDARRPQNARWWQQQAWHERLRRASYLYYFAESRVAMYLPASDRSYVEYILEDYAPGTLEWAEFERYFHNLAQRAKELAPIRLLVLYPQVPFREPSPLEPIHDRLTTLATRASRLEIPPAAWIRHAGTPVGSAEAPWRQAVKVVAGTTGPVLETREYYLPAGGADVTLFVIIDAAANGMFGTLDVIDAMSNEVSATLPLAVPAGAKPGWQAVTVHPGSTAHPAMVRLRLSSLGTTGFSVANVGISIDYGFKVVDLSGDLNTFNTHASIFDSHPNEEAHKVMAEKIVEALRQVAPRH